MKIINKTTLAGLCFLLSITFLYSQQMKKNVTSGAFEKASAGSDNDGGAIIGTVSSGTFDYTSASTSFAEALGLTNTSDKDDDCVWYNYDYVEECLDEITKTAGYKFYIHPEFGMLMYGDEDKPDEGQELSCLSFCPYNAIDGGVISANAIELTDDRWYSNDMDYEFESDANDFETGESGKWQVYKTHTYKTDITRKGQNNNRVYHAGVMKDFTSFNWNDVSENDEDKWVMLSNSTLWTPDGEVAEQKNALDINSCVKNGYGSNLPYLVAENAQYESVLFESFENVTYSGAISNSFEDGVFASKSDAGVVEFAHAGRKSLRVSVSSAGTGSAYSSNSYEATVKFLNSRRITSEILEGFIVKVWVYSPLSENPTLTLQEADYYGTGAKFDDVEFEEVAQTGYWKLYEAVVDENDWSSAATANVWGAFGFKIKFELNTIAMAKAILDRAIYMDDLLLKPKEAQINAYVYDVYNYKQLVQFDDQLFGTYYQYNLEGQLIRIIKETERGFKTIQETQYNMAQKDGVEEGSAEACAESDFIEICVFCPDYEPIVDKETWEKWNEIREAIEIGVIHNYYDEELAKIKYFTIKYGYQEVDPSIQDIYIDVVYNYMTKATDQMFRGGVLSNSYTYNYYNNFIKSNASVADVVSYETFTNLLSGYKSYNTSSLLNVRF